MVAAVVEGPKGSLHQAVSNEPWFYPSDSWWFVRKICLYTGLSQSSSSFRLTISAGVVGRPMTPEERANKIDRRLMFFIMEEWSLSRLATVKDSQWKTDLKCCGWGIFSWNNGGLCTGEELFCILSSYENWRYCDPRKQSLHKPIGSNLLIWLVWPQAIESRGVWAKMPGA